MAEKTTNSYTIRQATQADVAVILQLINELASYEKSLHEVLATEEKLLNTLSFPDNPDKGYAKTILICPPMKEGAKDEVAGLAVYFHNYSTWTAAPGIYLDDLFVRPQYRGKGFGKALLQALGRECKKIGCQRLEWWVLKWNEPSLKFYMGSSVNARRMDEWVSMRVDGDKLDLLADAGE